MNIINLSLKKSSSSIYFIIVGITIVNVSFISFSDGPSIEIKIDTDDSGNIIHEFQYYKQGKFIFNHGFHYSYFPDGTKKETGFYEHGKKDSVWVYFGKTGGMIKKKESWENGELVEEKSFKKNIRWISKKG